MALHDFPLKGAYVDERFALVVPGVLIVFDTTELPEVHDELEIARRMME
jgi:hypothetical protein